MLSKNPLSWAETRSRLRADHRRLLNRLQAGGGTSRRRAYFHPSFVCVFLYRVAHYYSRAGRNWLARTFWHLNIIVTGADISEFADIGSGLVVCNPPGVAIMGTAGRNLTVMACAGLGGEVGREDDVGAGNGLALVGDDVVLEPHSGILGPVRIGHRVRVGAGVLVTRDLPDDSEVAAPEPRFLKRQNTQ